MENADVKRDTSQTNEPTANVITNSVLIERPYDNKSVNGEIDKNNEDSHILTQELNTLRTEIELNVLPNLKNLQLQKKN